MAERVMRLVGRPEVIEEPWFGSGPERAKHGEEPDAVASWVAQCDFETVAAAFEETSAAVAPICDICQVMTDPQLRPWTP